jgi:uncharacterized phiE125 gp8 family phage protein
MAVVDRSLVLKTAPTAEPDEYADAMTHARVVPGMNDDRFQAMYVAARDQIDLETRRQYMRAIWTLRMQDWWSGILELPRPPLQSVTAVRYQNSADVETTLSSDVYTVVLQLQDSPFGGIFLTDGQAWPNLYGATNVAEIEIDFYAGYTTTATVSAQRAALPRRYVLAVRELASHFYWNGVTDIPAGILRMIWGLKVPVLEYQEVA